MAAPMEWLIPWWVEYLLPPIVRSWNGTQILSKCCLVFKVSSWALSMFLHQEMFTTMKCGWVRESSPNRTKTSAEFSGILTPKKECGSDKGADTHTETLKIRQNWYAVGIVMNSGLQWYGCLLVVRWGKQRCYFMKLHLLQVCTNSSRWFQHHQRPLNKAKSPHVQADNINVL